MQQIEYEITDVDWFEQDALLHVNGEVHYFQWPAIEEPTFLDAITYLQSPGQCWSTREQ